MPNRPADADAELLRPMNHVFVDFENVHHVDAGVFEGRRVSLVLLLGAKQTRLEVDLVETLLKHAAAVEMVRLSFSGKNALDFTLAYYVGRAAAADPAGYFHIVSKDAGFDPLVAHLRSRNIRAERHADFSGLTFSGKAKGGGAPVAKEAGLEARAEAVVERRDKDPGAHVLEHLREHPKNRPTKRKTLERHLLSVCGKGATAAMVEGLLGRLVDGGYISVDEKGAVSYALER